MAGGHLQHQSIGSAGSQARIEEERDQHSPAAPKRSPRNAQIKSKNAEASNDDVRLNSPSVQGDYDEDEDPKPLGNSLPLKNRNNSISQVHKNPVKVLGDIRAKRGSVNVAQQRAQPYLLP